MAVTGIKPLFKLQAAIEATRGTDLPATRIQPIISGNLVDREERIFLQEERNSFIANYRSIVTKTYSELAGIEVAPTYEDLPWFLQFFAKGGVSGVLEDITAYRYTFTPTVATDDLKTATFETGDDTNAWQVNYGIGTRFELTLARNAPASMSVDFLGQKSTSTTYTGALSDRVTEDINGALTAVYIDADGGTIGNSAVTNVLEVKVGLETAQTQFWALTGSVDPSDAYRNAPRKMTVDAKIVFRNTTEYDAWKANTTTDSKRLVRVSTSGSTVSGSSTAKLAQFDMYVSWTEAPFSEEEGLRVIQFSGETEYYASASKDWDIQVVNGLSALP